MGDNTASAKKELTAAEAAKLVHRKVTVAITDKEGNAVKDNDGIPRTKVERVAIEAKEVLSFKDCGSHVVVVTKDGHKFSSATDAE